MGMLDKMNDVLEKISDFQEGDAIPVGLLNDPAFVEQVKSLLGRYSKFPAVTTRGHEGTCYDFLYFITEIYTEDENNLKLFELGLKRAIEDYFMRRGATVSVVVISDEIGNDGWKVTAYFAWTRKQNKKLAYWYERLSSEERKRALQDIADVHDPELERELRGLGKNAD